MQAPALTTFQDAVSRPLLTPTSRSRLRPIYSRTPWTVEHPTGCAIVINILEHVIYVCIWIGIGF
jgi:hypothetical protein